MARVPGSVLVAAIAMAAMRSSDAAPPRTIVATGLSQAEVQAAIDQAGDGDTVRLPAGTAAWSSAVRVEGKYLSIAGAGTDKTTIVSGEDYAGNDEEHHDLLLVSAKAGGLTRLTGLTFDGGDGPRDGYNKGLVALSGPSQTWRIDDVRFRATRTCAMRVYASGGVIDHCRFDLVGWTFGIYGFNGGSPYGDLAWTMAAPLGDGHAPFFIEDNQFVATDNSVALDGWNGERVVFRHNSVVNCAVCNHGTESSGRLRGCRSMEIYDNRITLRGRQFYTAIGLRSGTVVIFNNVIEGNCAWPMRVDNYRDFDSFAPWGIASGASPFDKNDLDADGRAKVFDKGICTAGDNAHDLVSTGKQWKPNQWVGYSVINTVTGKSCAIFSNTADKVVTRYDDTHGGPNLLWNRGDGFEIRRCLVALDETGRGMGSMISGDDPTPVAWPNQEPGASYVWNNTLNGKVVPMLSGTPHIQEGVDFFNGVPMRGYRLFPYPHPLTRR